MSIDTQRDKAGFHFREDIAPGLCIETELKGIVHSTESEYQKINVIDTFFGRTLITDGKTQSTAFDEFVYHDCLVHPSLLNFTKNAGRGPKTVFIGGGGELATAREVLRHKSVERVVMVDLDGAVVDVCVDHLQEWGGQKVKDDPRMELIIGDAYAYLLNTKEQFDVIILDISDPIEAGPGIMLYTKELYQHAKTLLHPNGIFVTQAGAADSIPLPHSYSEDNKDTTCFAPIRNTLAEVFGSVLPYSHNIPSFGNDWGFVMAFQSPENQDAATLQKEWKEASADTIDELIETSVTGGECRLYDGETHRTMFNLSKPLRKLLANDKRVMTKENPVFMY